MSDRWLALGLLGLGALLLLSGARPRYGNVPTYYMSMPSGTGVDAQGRIAAYVPRGTDMSPVPASAALGSTLSLLNPLGNTSLQPDPNWMANFNYLTPYQRAQADYAAAQAAYARAQAAIAGRF